MLDNAIAPEIYQLAKTYHLGEPTARYETLPRTIRRIRFSLSMLYSTVIAILLGLFALLSYMLYMPEFSRVLTGVFPDPGAYLLFVLGWPILWIVVIWWILRDNFRVTFQKTFLYLCTLGILGYNEQDRLVTVIPWDKIETVWLLTTPVYVQISPEKHETRNDWKYTFVRIDGKKFIFQGHFGIEALREVVEKEVTARLLPNAIATYEEGLPGSFGDVQVSRKGIQMGQQTIAWQNVLYVDLKGDQFIVRLPDWEHWVGTDKAGIPNVCVLEALIHHIIAGKEHSIASNLK